MLKNELNEKTRYLRAHLKRAGFDIGKGHRSIIPIYIRDDREFKQMEKLLIEYDIYTVAIQYPIVKAGISRFIEFITQLPRFGRTGREINPNPSATLDVLIVEIVFYAIVKFAAVIIKKRQDLSVLPNGNPIMDR